MLKAIDEIGEGVMGGIHSAAPTTGSASGLGLGDSMRDAIDSAGTFGQIPCLILLIIPFLVSKGATIVVTVVILLRFVQIYMLTAFNPLPIAFIAQEETRQWGVNYFKQYASLVFQCATLYLAILMYRTFVGGTLNPSKYKDGDSLSGWVLDNFTACSWRASCSSASSWRPIPSPRSSSAANKGKEPSWRCRCPSTGS